MRLGKYDKRSLVELKMMRDESKELAKLFQVYEDWLSEARYRVWSLDLNNSFAQDMTTKVENADKTSQNS